MVDPTSMSLRTIAFGIAGTVCTFSASAFADQYPLCVGERPVTVYAQPSTGSKPVAQPVRGTELIVRHERGPWAFVSAIDEQEPVTGWVSLASLGPCQTPARRTAFHPFGRPLGDVKGGVLLENIGYDCMHDPDLKLCRWVGYCYQWTAVSSRRYRGEFVADMRLPAGSRAEPADYAGLHRGTVGLDRGHQAPDASLKVLGRDAQKETYRLSNVTPQYSLLNQGLWRELEENIRKWATPSSPVCVQTGPVFFTDLTIERVGKNKVAVPHAYFAIVTQGESPAVIALLVRNEPVRRSWREVHACLASVDTIEALTGFDFFTTLSAARQNGIESAVAASLWDSPSAPQHERPTRPPDVRLGGAER